MSTLKAILYAAGITVVSVVCLAIVKGAPTTENLIGSAVTIFAMTFVVMKFWGGVLGR